MILYCEEIGLRLNVNDDLLKDILIISRKHYPNEFGGFLIGYYSDDFKTLTVTDTILPQRYKSTKYLFERDAVGIEGKLEQLYNEDPQKYYIGEWHTHPDNPPYLSDTDKNAIHSIINHQDVKINNPIFLVIGLRQLQEDLAFYIPYKNKIYQYEKHS